MSSPAPHLRLRTETHLSPKRCVLFWVLDDRGNPKQLPFSVTDGRKNSFDLTFPLPTSKFVSSNPIFNFENVINCSYPIHVVRVQKCPVVIEWRHIGISFVTPLANNSISYGPKVSWFTPHRSLSRIEYQATYRQLDAVMFRYRMSDSAWTQDSLTDILYTVRC
jgi:hypothetical protein